MYKERLAKWLIAEVKAAQYKELQPYAKRSVAIFCIGVFVIVTYALAISPTIGLIKPMILGRDNAIISFMLTVDMLIVMLCKVDSSKLISTSTFQSGMNACIYVMGIAWLGNTFVNGHLDS